MFLLLAALALQDTPPSGSLCDSPRQYDMNICMWKIASQAEQRMEDRYAEVLGVMSETDRRLREDGYLGLSRPAVLERGQEAWQAYREAHCDFEGLEYVGGSIVPSVEAKCYMRLADARERELAAALQPE